MEALANGQTAAWALVYSMDGPQYFRIVQSITFDRSLVFDPPLTWGSPIAAPITPIVFVLLLRFGLLALA